MSLFISSLNSGSNGNCYYIGTQEEGILIDGGISCRETEKRLKRIGLSIKKVKAIFISHEHGDHIHGVPALCKKHKVPVYVTEATLKNSNCEIDPALIVHFSAHQPIVVGDLTVTPFPKFHDAIDPHSFVVSNGSVTIGIFTDIGHVCDNVKKYFARCHAAFLESNYDEEMLERGRYPYYLKERIRGDRGHLSNVQAFHLFTDHRPDHMSHVFLSHLSRDNNSPKLVKQLFSASCGNTQVVVASREKQSPLYHIRNVQQIKPAPSRKPKPDYRLQIPLFQ